jgi:hypothetical protein
VPGSQRAQADTHPAPKGVEPEGARPVQDSVTAPAALHSGAPPSPNASLPSIPFSTVPPDNAPLPEKTTAAAPAPLADRAEIESHPELAKAPAPAREIQVQVNNGEQRVDVRLTERSGEVLVAVRTPDAQLAGTLREDLPVLSSRLEQAGFRAETWHLALPAAENRLSTAQSHSSNTSSQDQNSSRQGGQEQPQSPPRQPKPPAAQAATNAQPKEFAWLMSQLP